MSFNLVDSVKGLFSNDLINNSSSMLGENAASVRQAINGIVPAVLTGVLSKAASGDVQGIMSLAKNALSGFSLDKLGSLFSGGESMLSKGADMLKGLFADKTSNVVSAISGFAGIKESSASSLMSIAAPAALGVLGKQVADTRADASGVLSLLNSQKDHILGALPSGLNLAGALGIGSLTSIGSKLSGALSGIQGGMRDAGSKVGHMAESAADKASGGMRWLLPLLLVVLVIGLIWYFVKGRSSNESTVTAMDTAAKTVDTPVAAVLTPPAKETLKVKLPDGVELDAYKGGIEDQLVIFLNDPTTKPGKDIWFDFDNLNFKTGSADITDESQKQVQNIAAILKAYPKVKIKIGGYTDRTGDSVGNMKLSEARAKSVQAALKKDGSNAGQLTGAEGYGSKFAKAAADASDDEKMKDRRISVSVRAK